MLRLLRTLRERQVLTPAAIVLAFLLILSLIIVLGQFFHQTLQSEMADQFNKQQLLLARQVAINVVGFVEHVHKDISVISRLPGVHRADRDPAVRAVIAGIHYHFESDILVTIRVVSGRGIVLYDSSQPGMVGSNISKMDCFRRSIALRRNDLLITELLDDRECTSGAKQFIMATPVYQERADGAEEFRGVVQAVISMDGITQKYLSPVKSGTRGYAWMMDASGALLYHPTQPQMVGKNLFRADPSCFQCHVSFESEKKMIAGTAESSGRYEAPGGENKLAAYYKIEVGDRSWVVVVSAPYTEVISLMYKSRSFYSLLIISIFLTTLAAAAIFIVTYKKRIKAEERAMHLESQRRLEQEIVIAKNYLENIIENTRTNLMVLDRDLVVKTVNTAQADTLRRQKGQILGRPFLGLFPEGLGAYGGVPLDEILRHTLSSETSQEIKEYRVTGIQPEPIYLDMNISPLLIAGEVTGVVITSTNVTKRVLLEEALKRYTVELEDRVDREVAAHQKLEQQVLHSEKLAALGRLAAGVAHEIGNPLTSISTFAQLLREMAQDEFSQSSLDIINNHIRRITEIVGQMSTFSRPGATNIRPHQVNDILTSALDLMRLDKRMKSTIEMATDFAGDVPETLIDDGQIAQVFINIVLNALDAMPDGGKLTVSTRKEAGPDGRETIAVRFTDTGTGISRESIEKIFDPFYTTKDVGKGTGLGLSVSYNIVKRFHGDIKVESAPGKGTTFTVLLPVATAQSKEPPHE